MPRRSISIHLLTMAEAWQAETRPVVRRAYYDLLVRCLPPAMRDLYSAVVQWDDAGFGWQGEWKGKGSTHAWLMHGLKTLRLVRMEGRRGNARWYAVGAMERTEP